MADTVQDQQHGEHDRPLVVDEVGETLERFRALTNSGEADVLLDELGAHGPVDEAIVSELSAVHAAGPSRASSPRPTRSRCTRWRCSNATAPRVTKMPRVGPLKPIASWAVQLVTRFIVRSHQGEVIDAITRLYARRLAWCPPGYPHRMMLLRARLDSERAVPAFKGKAVGLPTFLVGGAVVSSLASGVRGLASVLLGSAASPVASAWPSSSASSPGWRGRSSRARPSPVAASGSPPTSR